MHVRTWLASPSIKNLGIEDEVFFVVSEWRIKCGEKMIWFIWKWWNVRAAVLIFFSSLEKVLGVSYRD